MGKKLCERITSFLLLADASFSGLWKLLDVLGRAEIMRDLYESPLFTFLGSPKVLFLCMFCGIWLLFLSREKKPVGKGLYDQHGTLIDFSAKRNLGWLAVAAAFTGVVVFSVLYFGVADMQVKRQAKEGIPGILPPAPPGVINFPAATIAIRSKNSNPVTACSDPRVAKLGNKAWYARRASFPDEPLNESACAVDAVLAKRGWTCRFYDKIPSTVGNGTVGVLLGTGVSGNTFQGLRIEGTDYGVIVDGPENHFTDTEITAAKGQTVLCTSESKPR